MMAKAGTRSFQAWLEQHGLTLDELRSISASDWTRLKREYLGDPETKDKSAAKASIADLEGQGFGPKAEAAQQRKTQQNEALEQAKANYASGNLTPADQKTIADATQSGELDPEELAKLSREQDRSLAIFANYEDVYSGDKTFSFIARETPGQVVPREGLTDEQIDRQYRGRAASITSPTQDIVTFGQYLNTAVAWSSEQIRAMQDRLEAAHLLGDKSMIDGARNYQPGYLDEATERALRAAAYESSLRRKSLDDVIDERVKLVTEQPGEDELQKSFEDQYRQSLFRSYFDTWGTVPPPGYIEHAASAGVNVFEFAYAERLKPAYKNSPRFGMDRVGLSSRISDRFGFA